LTTHTTSFPQALRFCALAGALALLTAAGCKQAPTDDATLANNVQKAIANDASINKEPIQSSVAAGVATLNGTVSNDTARMVASEDASHVAGIRQVVNNLSVVTTTPAVDTKLVTPVPAPSVPGPSAKPSASGYVPPAPLPNRPSHQTPAQEREWAAHHQNPNPHQNPNQYPNQAQNQGDYNRGPMPPPPPVQMAVAPPPPPPPPVPVYRDVRVPPGTPIAVRMTQTLDSATAQPDAPFSGVLNSPIMVEGETVIPAGSAVTGRVVTVHEAGHFSGNSLLTVELTAINRHGEHISITSEPYTVTGKGRGKNTAEKAGGGAVVGAVLGGIFGGGKGAAIGAGAGGAVGAGSNGITRGQQVQIASESIVSFRLANGITVRTRGNSHENAERNSDNNPNQNQGDPNLQRR
jgi:hypothetical protein